jgi:signal recognition particle subunit SRP54
MMGDVDAEKDMKRLQGIIDSMTPEERRNPSKTIDTSRRRRIAAGAGVEPHEVNDLVKQFDGMADMMKQMATMSIRDRLRAVNELQQKGGLHPGAKFMKTKQGTGKRLTSEERAKLKKQREKEERRRKRETREK